MRKSLVLLGLAFSASACSIHGPSIQSTGRSASVPPAAAPLALGLTSTDATIIRDHYTSDSGGKSDSGRGRGRGNGLPPGIEKNLARGKPLPPGIAKQHLPPELLGRLQPVPRGLEYVIVAGKLLLVEISTQIIRDVLLEAVFD